MADCFPFPPESDDLHWLPREIFADIGIVDTESVVVTDPTPESAAAAVVEELAAQLAGILGGGGSKVWPLAPTPPPAPPAAAPRHAAKVCGLEGSVAMSFGGSGTNAAAAAAAAVSWPFVPYPQFHWQVGNTLVNHGGVLDYPMLPPALPCHVVPSPPANLRGGTGVFLPRVEAYRYAVTHPATAKGGAAARPSWAGTGTGSTRPATGKKQQQQQTEHATPTKQQHQKKQQQQATGHAALALPQDWSYR